MWFSPSDVRVGLRMDPGAPGAHLVWEVENTGTEAVTLTKVVVHSARGRDTTLPLDLPHVLAPKDQFVVPTDVDSGLLAAESVAIVDVDGCEYSAPRREFADVRNQLSAGIDRRFSSLSARDFLSGAAEAAFGVAILGLGFFMLMYAVATG